MREFCTKWWKRIATVDMLFIGVLTLLASLFASWLKQFPGFSLFGALIIALLIGMIIQFPIRSAYVGSNDGRKAGVKDAAGLISNKLLRLGIILLVSSSTSPCCSRRASSVCRSPLWSLR